MKQHSIVLFSIAFSSEFITFHFKKKSIHFIYFLELFFAFYAGRMFDCNL